MKSVALIIMVAIVLEALVEYYKTIIKLIEDGEYKTAITQAATIALGVGLAFTFNLHLFNDVLSQFYEGISISPVIDTILTGILFSRGSNYFSDLIKRLTTISGAYEDVFDPDELKIKVGDGTDMDSFLKGED